MAGGCVIRHDYTHWVGRPRGWNALLKGGLDVGAWMIPVKKHLVYCLNYNLASEWMIGVSSRIV